MQIQQQKRENNKVASTKMSHFKLEAQFTWLVQTLSCNCSLKNLNWDSLEVFSQGLDSLNSSFLSNTIFFAKSSSYIFVGLEPDQHRTSVARANIACDRLRFMDNYGFTRTRLFCYIALCGKKKDVSHLISYLVLHSEHKAEMQNHKAFLKQLSYTVCNWNAV